MDRFVRAPGAGRALEALGVPVTPARMGSPWDREGGIGKATIEVKGNRGKALL